jgi:hypothetical protein
MAFRETIAIYAQNQKKNASSVKREVIDYGCKEYTYLLLRSEHCYHCILIL